MWGRVRTLGETSFQIFPFKFKTDAILGIKTFLVTCLVVSSIEYLIWPIKLVSYEMASASDAAGFHCVARF